MIKQRAQNPTPEPTAAGRYDLLFMRLAERITREFERETGIHFAWSLLRPHAETVAAKIEQTQKGLQSHGGR